MSVWRESLFWFILDSMEHSREQPATDKLQEVEEKLAKISLPDELSISTLPFRLFLVTVQKEQIDLYLKGLLHLAFLSSQDSSFFSYSETDEEISFILDEQSLQIFKDQSVSSLSGMSSSIVVFTECWKAIQVYEGSSAINQVGLVAKLSAPLASARLPIIYLSTYNTDLILVPEDKEKQALDLLKSNLAHKQKPQKKAASSENLKAALSSTASSRPSVGSSTARPPQFVVTPLPHRLSISTFKSSDFTESNALTMLKLLVFHSSHTSRLFSITRCPGEMSFIMDKTSVSQFKENALEAHADTWRAIQVLGEGTSTVGNNVNAFSQVLASASIAIYYLSTFNSDFILVPEGKVDAAINCLKEHFFIIIDEE